MRIIYRISITIVFLTIQAKTLFAQDIVFNEPFKIIATEKIQSNIKEDTELQVIGMSLRFNGGISIAEVVTRNSDGTLLNFDAKKIDKFICKDLDSRDKIWNKNLLFNGALANMLTKGYQYDIRNDLNNEAIEYINTLHVYNLFYKEEYFEDYLYTLINKIHYGILKDKRPGNIYLKIIQDPEPNAFTLSNGCIILSTGLLSSIQSEDELIGILAHEIAHFVLDHQILNYNLAIDRKKKAEFWATFATAIAASADIYLAANNENYIPGVLTASTAISATIVSQEITQRLGINYSQQQEIEADNVAKEILGVLNYDKSGLSVALFRIKEHYVKTGNYLALSGSGTHPSLDSRINSLGIVDSFDNFTQSGYLKKVSFINSYNAIIEIDVAHYLTANELVNRNINNSVATETDYIVKAIIQRRLSNTKESNEEVIALLNKAKAININPPLRLHKEEAISLLRLKRKTEAKKSLQTYLIALLDIRERNEVKEIKNYNKSLQEEINWTKRMIFKIDNL